MRLAYYILAVLLIFSRCAKEFSFEQAPRAKGSIACGTGIIHGYYNPNETFTDSNYLQITVNFDSPGLFRIYSDTVNGVWFSDTATDSKLGMQIIKLKAYGKPTVFGAGQHVVYFGNSQCTVTAPILQAVYSFVQRNSNCGRPVISGEYNMGSPLTVADSVVMQVIVSQPGSYSLQAGPVNGMSFSARGNFSSTGNYPITLKGSGTPLLPGTSNLPVKISSGNSCSFNIPVEIKADTTKIDSSSMYFSFEVAGDKVYTGTLDSAFMLTFSDIGNANTVNQLMVNNYNRRASDTSFIIAIDRVNSPVTKGKYLSYAATASIFISDFSFAFDYTLPPSTFIYGADISQPHDLILHLTNFNQITGLVQGRFSGIVKNWLGETAVIQKGMFSCYMKRS
jgi:hypothetical protein